MKSTVVYHVFRIIRPYSDVSMIATVVVVVVFVAMNISL